MIEPRNLKFYKTKRKITAFALAGFTFISAVGLSGCGKENKSAISKQDEKAEQLIISTVDIDSIGSKISFPDEKSENNTNTKKSSTTTPTNKPTSKTTAKIDIDGKKVVIDTKNDTLVVTPEGKVKEKAEGYEIKDTTGKVIETGQGSVPQGKVWDEEQKAYVDPSDLGKYTVLDTNYYDKTTKQLVLEKGILVEKADFASTTANLIPESQLNQSTTNENIYVYPEQPIYVYPEQPTYVYPDQNICINQSTNTYPIDVTYNGYVYSDANYCNSNGVPVIEEGELVTQAQLDYAKQYYKRVKKYNSDLDYVYSDAEYRNNEGRIMLNYGEMTTRDYLQYAQQNFTRIQRADGYYDPYVPQYYDPYVPQNNTYIPQSTPVVIPQSTPVVTPQNNEGIITSSGLYSINGMTFQSKADYDQWVIQGYNGYAEVNGIMMPENQIGSYQIG